MSLLEKQTCASIICGGCCCCMHVRMYVMLKNRQFSRVVIPGTLWCWHTLYHYFTLLYCTMTRVFHFHWVYFMLQFTELLYIPCCCWCMRQFHLFHFVILYLKWIHSRRLLSRKLLLIVCVCVWCKEMLETQRKRVNEVRATKWRVGVHIMHSFNMQPKGELGKCLFCNSTSIQETLQPTQQLQLPLFSFI